MSFTNPDVLLLLLILPVLTVVGWPRLAYRRRRDWLSLITRLILATLLILSLAGVQSKRAADKLAVVFLMDFSDSISPAMRDAELKYVQAAAETMGTKDQAAVVVFGADALVEIPMTQRLELIQIGSSPIRLNTDLAEAMRLGLALFPPDTAKRMVVLSDGKQTIDNAEEVARLAAATDVQVDYVSLLEANQSLAGSEILITDVQVPSKVNAGEKFDLTVTIASTQRDSQAEVRVLASGQIIHRQEVTLQSGTNTFIFPDIVVSDPGFVDFRVVVEPRSPDTFYQNNQLSAFTEVSGPPRVLLVTSDEREITELRTVLEQTGLQVEVQNPHDLPMGLAPLSSYDCIVLANVSATQLTQTRMEYLQTYVRDLGRGLVVIGGPDSYGVGGYYKTPLEEILPVEMRIRDQKRLPALTLLFVIDRSGSMQIAGPSGVTNLELAKEAVARSIDLLNDTDRVGVLSFDVDTYYVLQLQTVGDEANRNALREEVGTLRPGGGTDIRQGILSAEQVLSGDPSQLKHIILLTDGGSDPADVVERVDQMYQKEGITTSVVAVGQDYAPWLQDVAAAGRGKFHLAYDISTIPAIFTSETLLATRSYISEQEFLPTLVTRHPIMSGLSNMPTLLGYVATTPKETATVILSGLEDDPILATWQYGLGRSVAFTSDATSRWAANWIGWDGYANFWSQAVRWTIIEGVSNNLEAHVVQRGEQAVLIVDARDNRGNYLNGMQLDASVVNSQLGSTPLQLQQTAPGRYEAAFTPTREGSYFITVAGQTPESASAAPQQIVQTTGWVMSYSAEYRVDVTGVEQNQPLALLKNISQITGGGSLQGKPQNAFSHNLNQEQTAQYLWPTFLLLALLLLPFDIAIRRLVVSRRDLQRVWSLVNRRLLARPQPAYEPSERLGRLMDAKDRVRGTTPQAEPSPAPVVQPATLRPERLPETPPPVPKPVPSSAPAVRPKTSSPAEESGSLASRLLERRRSSQDKDRS